MVHCRQSSQALIYKNIENVRDANYTVQQSCEPLTGCGGAEPHPMVKSTSTTFGEQFHIILRKYQKLWTKILNIFFMKMEFHDHSFHNFSSLK